MPVFVPGVPQFKIRPPVTCLDRGKPSDSILKDTERVFDLIEDERHLVAEKLLHSVETRMKKWEAKEASPKKSSVGSSFGTRRKSIEEKHSQFTKAQQLLHQNEKRLEVLRNRCRIFRKAQANLNENDDWTHASTHFGIKTYYRREEDGSLSIKLEGDMKDLPLFEQVCVMKEVDLHYKWAPFTSSSLVLADLDKLDTVGWFMVGVPHFGLTRDGCIRAIGCDNFAEDGTILLAAQGIRDIPEGKPQPEETFLRDDPILEKLNIPPVPKRIGAGRMTMRKFEAMIHVTSPTSATTKVVANVDPNISFLPQSLLEFVMKHMAGVLLFKLQGAAKKAMKDPVNNMHAKRMRDEADFYRDWLLPKFKAICDAKGWELPDVRALNLTPAEQEKENRNRRSMGRGVSFDVANAISDDSDTNRNDSPRENRERLNTNDTDTISELSFKSTGSLWSNNPVTTYLKKVEEKAERAREERAAETRRRAAVRLQPKELSKDQAKRLNELRELKTKRSSELKQAKSFQSRTSSDSRGKTSSEQVTEGLRSFSFYVRVTIVSCIAVALFALLHPKLVSHVDIENWRLESELLVAVLKDFAKLLYLTVVTGVHFILCDISLVYTFDSLDLGKKAGRQIREFYSNNVRLAIAAFSVGIFLFSIAKASLSLLIQFSIWALYQGWGYFSEYLLPRIYWFGHSLLSLCPSFIRDSIFMLASWPAKLGLSVTSFSAKALHATFVKSNTPMRLLESIVLLIAHSISSIFQAAHRFGRSSIERFEGGPSATDWGDDLFVTAKYTFSYTAVFLLTALSLFGIFARMSKIKIETTLGSTDPAKEIVPPPASLIQQMSSLSNGTDEAVREKGRRRFHISPPIPEDEVVDMPTPLNDRHGNTPQMQRASMRRRAQSAV